MTAPRSHRLKAAFLRLAAAILVAVAILLAISFSGLAASGPTAEVVRRTSADITPTAPANSWFIASLATTSVQEIGERSVGLAS